MPIRPQVLSVEQAGRVLGIGRTLAYEQARAWIATDGAKGFPCRRVGRLLRVYRPELEGWLGFPIEWPPADARETASPSAAEAASAGCAAQPQTDPSSSTQAAHRSRIRRQDNQSALPFAD